MTSTVVEQKRLGGQTIVIVVLLAIAAGISWLFWSRGRALEKPVPAIAILPFRGDTYFADGLTIELIDSLSKVEKLKVVSWNAAVRYRGKAGNLQELREQLQAGAVLDASATLDGDRVEVSAKLIDTTRGDLIWTDTYRRPAKDIFYIEEQIAKSIVYSLKVPLRMDPQRLLVPPRTESIDAYSDYLHARCLRSQFSPQSLEMSIEFASKAIAEDPKYAPAYALLAMNQSLAGAYSQAKVTGRKAVDLDPSSSMAHAALGTALAFGEYDWKTSHLELQRAVEWSQGSADAHLAFALGYLLPTGQIEGAEYEARKAVELDPLSFLTNHQAGRVLLTLGKYSDAAGRFKTALSICGNCLTVQQDYEAAVEGAKATFTDRDLAFAALDQAIANHNPSATFLPSDVRFVNLRGDPRYIAALKKLKLKD